MLTLAFVSSVALADLPPPAGTRRVTFAVSVENAAAFPGFQMVVYPWSASDGAPTAEVGPIPTDGVLAFGRRIQGAPSLWAIPAGTSAPPDDAGLAVFFAPGGGAIPCAGPIERIFTAPEAGPPRVVQVWHIDRLDATGCAMSPVNHAPAAPIEPPPPPPVVPVTPPSSAFGCATSSGMAGVGAILGAALLLVTRRR